MLRKMVFNFRKKHPIMGYPHPTDGGSPGRFHLGMSNPAAEFMRRKDGQAKMMSRGELEMEEAVEDAGSFRRYTNKKVALSKQIEEAKKFRGELVFEGYRAVLGRVDRPSDMMRKVWYAGSEKHVGGLHNVNEYEIRGTGKRHVWSESERRFLEKDTAIKTRFWGWESKDRAR